MSSTNKIPKKAVPVPVAAPSTVVAPTVAEPVPGIGSGDDVSSKSSFAQIAFLMVTEENVVRTPSPTVAEGEGTVGLDFLIPITVPSLHDKRSLRGGFMVGDDANEINGN
jgi:hypothetical protein